MKKNILFIIGLIIITISYIMIIINLKDSNVNYDFESVSYYTIYLKGEVKYEGELMLPKGTKVGDVIEPYLTKNSDISSIDVEEYIIDKKVYNILYKDKISINDASLNELLRLKDIGDVRANDIINNRPYNNINELVSRGILTDGIFKKIRNDISI